MQPLRRDILLAAFVVACAAAEVALNPSIQPKGAAAATEILLGVALAWRRVFPIACVLVVSLCVGLEASLGVPVNEPSSLCSDL